MRILHISKYYHPFRGGIEKVIQELAEGTARAGHDVTVICSNDCWEYKEEMVDGVRVIRLPRYTVTFSQPITMSFFWQMKKWMQWADIVQLHTPNPLAELAFLFQDIKKPLIVNYHCDVVRQKRMVKLYRPVAQKVLQRADKIVVSTPNHLKFSEPILPHLDKTEVIPFGVRAKHAERTMEITHRMKNIKDELGDYFLFVGRLVPYKGIDILLKAMKDVKQKLAIIGTGPRWEAWNQMAKDYGVADKVKFVGLVEEDAEFAAYLHGCHSLVLPSINESEAFGIVLIEAMSCSKPVITTNLKSGVPWVNDQGVTGLQVEPSDVDGLLKALNTLGSDHKLRQQMGTAARVRYEMLFKTKRMIQGYQELYEEFVKDSQEIAA